MSNAWRVVITEQLNADAEARLAAQADVVRPASLSEDDLVAAVKDADAIVARTRTTLSRGVLAAGARLRVVGIAGVGLDRVDEAAAAELGVVVLNRPGAATQAVAELAVALMLNVLRPIARMADDYRAGRFAEARARPHGAELHGLTLGIVGMGRIGQAVGRIAALGFAMRVIYNDIVEIGQLPFDATAVDKATLWSESDVISLHTPLSEATRGLVDAEVLQRLRRDAVLINTSRGAVVETAALSRALEDGRLRGAGLDVTEPEPLPVGHWLLTSPRCVVTPHVAARTTRGVANMHAIVDDVLAYLAESD